MASYLRDVLKPQSPSGFSNDRANLKEWSAIASDYSHTATRATDKPVKLPSTGGDMTSSPPRGFNADPYKAAKADLNHAGSSSYMKNVRRGPR